MSIQEGNVEQLDEPWKRVLAIVAHPDDLEYGASAAIAKWTASGKWVGYVIVTDGEAGIDGMFPRDASPARRREQLEAASIVGVNEVTFLGQPDGIIEYNIALRRLLAAEIRRYTPDVLVTTTHHLTFGHHQLNQSDHRHVGMAVFDAAKDAGNRWIHKDLLTDGLEPHLGVESVLVFGSTAPTHAVDVTGHLDSAVASLQAHASYLKGLGREFDPADFLQAATTAAGRDIGFGNAVAFERFSTIGV